MKNKKVILILFVCAVGVNVFAVGGSVSDGRPSITNDGISKAQSQREKEIEAEYIRKGYTFDKSTGKWVNFKLNQINNKRSLKR
jgi:hypothetical protein